MTRKKVIIGSVVLLLLAASACFCMTSMCSNSGTCTAESQLCGGCGKSSCDANCTLNHDTTMKDTVKTLSCKLTGPELQKRKATAIANLKSNQKEKVELENGFAFRFEGSDEMIDMLTDFVKSERQCCDFFSFAIRIEGDNFLWLDITGPAGTKDFIKTELDL